MLQAWFFIKARLFVCHGSQLMSVVVGSHGLEFNSCFLVSQLELLKELFQVRVSA